MPNQVEEGFMDTPSRVEFGNTCSRRPKQVEETFMETTIHEYYYEYILQYTYRPRQSDGSRRIPLHDLNCEYMLHDECIHTGLDK
jgi:hypothetical protein